MSAERHSVEERLNRLHLELPPPPQAVGAYVSAVRAGKLVFLAGQIPIRDGKPVCQGKLGSELSASESGECVRAAVMNGLSALKVVIGDLDKVVRVVKLTGYVASAPGFMGQPAVLNHASRLLLAAFGERGRHARVAVGVTELPLGVPVELEMVFEVE
jgi:enamine deaminase RidA (YjgF/YER057c/UK114 family)